MTTQLKENIYRQLTNSSRSFINQSTNHEIITHKKLPEINLRHEVPSYMPVKKERVDTVISNMSSLKQYMNNPTDQDTRNKNSNFNSARKLSKEEHLNITSCMPHFTDKTSVFRKKLVLNRHMQQVCKGKILELRKPSQDSR